MCVSSRARERGVGDDDVVHLSLFVWAQWPEREPLYKTAGKRHPGTSVRASGARAARGAANGEPFHLSPAYRD
jgi:hypothetical protein